MAKQLNVNLSFNADTSKAKAQIQDLQNALNQLVKGSVASSASSGRLGITKELMEAQVAATKLQTILNQSMNSKTGNLDLTKFSESFNRAGMDLKVLKGQLDSLGPTGQKAFMSLASSIVSADVPLKRTNALVSELWTTMKNTVRWQITSSVLHGFMGTIQSAVGYAKDLNESLNNIRIVTGQSTEQMAAFAERANKAAKALSTTTTEYTNASLIYYQQGLNDQEVQDRTDITIKMAHASGQSAEIVSDQMTAVWNNFYDGSKSLEHYADVMTALGAATASSSDEIAGGLEKFASIADMIGLSYEYAASALATITATTRQSEDVVGTALKTIFARIQGLSLGETLDDGTNLNKYSEALQKVGISIFEQNGELKDMDNILNEMGAKWETLNKDQQVALAQTVAGVRQYNQLVSLMDNWDFFESNLDIANTSDGTLQEQADIYAESWQAARDRVKAAAQDIYDSILDSDFFIELLNGFEKVLSMIANFTDSIGGLKGVFAGLGVIITKVFSTQLAESVERLAFNLRSVTGETQRAASKLQELAVSEVNKMQFNTGTESGDAEAIALRRRLQLQNEIKNVAVNLNATQKEQLVDLLKINEAYSEQAIKAAQIKDAASDKVQETSSQLRTQIKRNEIDGTSIESRAGDFNAARTALKEIINEGAKAEGALSAINNSMNIKNAGNFGTALDRISKHLQNVGRTEASNKFGELKHSFEALVKSGKMTEAELDAFKAKLNEIVTSEEMLEDATIQGADAFKQALSAYGLTQEQVDKLANEMMDLVQAERHSRDSADASTKAHNQLKASIQGFKGAMDGFGQSVVKGMQGISQISMGLMSLKGIWDTLNNEDLTFGEKLLQVTMSLSMAIPSLIDGFQALKAAKIGEAAATVKSAVAKALDSIEAIKNAGASAAATAASTTLTGSLWGQVAAWLAVHTEMSSVMILLVSILGPILAVVAAAALLVGIGIAIYNEYNKASVALDRANETLKNTETALNDATTAAQAFKDEISGYDDAVDKLKDTTLSAKELAEASKEASEQAQELIEKYKLFDKVNWDIDKFGNTQLSEEGRKKLDEIEHQKDRVAQQAESVNTVSKINQAYAEVDDAATNTGRGIGYITDSPQIGSFQGGSFANTVSQKDVKQLGAVINQVRKSMGGIIPDADTLKQYIRDNADELFISTEVLSHLDEIVKNETIGSLTTFADKLIASEEAIDYFNKKLLSDAVEQTYGDTFSKIAVDKETGEVDEGLYNLMNEAAANIIANGGVQVEYTKKLAEDVLKKVSTWDAADATETNVKNLLGDIFGDFSGTDYTSANDYIAENYDKIFEGTTTNFGDGLNSTEMAQAYFESKGITITSVDNQSGKAVLNGVAADGETPWTQTVDNDKAQILWAEQVAAYAINERLGQLAEEQISHEELDTIFEELRNKGEQYGADFTTAILSGISNRKEGEDISFDFSSLFGNLNQDEVDKMLGMSNDDLMQAFGFTEEELQKLGFASADKFSSAFKDALKEYDPDVAFDQAAADLGMTSDALEQYIDNLQDNNEALKDNEELAREVAKAQIPLHRNIEKAAKVYKDNSKALNKVNEGTEEYATACSDMASALNDVFGDGVFDATMVANNLETVKKAMEGDIGAYEKLQDLAGEKLLIDAGVNIDEGVGQEINDWIGSQEFNDLEIGATLDSTGMTAAFQALLDSGAITVDQMNSILSGIGFEPDIDYVDVPLDQAAYNKDSNTYTVEYLDTEGNVQTKTITADQYNEAKGTGSIQVPIINGKETLKVSSPEAVAQTVKTDSGGGKKSTPAKPVKYTKKSDVIDRYKEQDDALDDIAETLEDINKESDRLYGTKRLKQMDNEQYALLAQKKALEGKAAAARDYLKTDKEALKNAGEKYGLNFDFDDLGNIKNYTTEMTKLYDELHAAEEKMDKMSTKEAQDEFQESTIQPIQDKIDELKGLISQYDTTKELLEDLEDEIDEAFYAWQDRNYEELQLKLELKLEVNDTELKKLEYFLDKYSDNFYKIAESATLMNDKINPAIQNLENYKSHKEALDESYRNGEISQEAYIEGLKEVREGYYDNLEALIELDKAMMHYYGDTLDAASEELSTFTDHMEHLTSIFDHYISLMEILGKQKNYDAMGNFLGSKANTIRDRLDVAKEYYKMLKENSQANEYWANYQAALFSGDEDMAQWWKEQWDAEIDALDAAQEEMLSLTEEWAEAMKSVIENNMNKITETLEKTLTGGTAFDTMMDEFDKLNTRQEEYLTKTNQIYETNKLMRTASKALDETDDKVAKQKLKNFIDETKSLQENTKLSQYELEIQQAKYDLLLAEIALEEAKNAQSTVRLSRDSEGNFGYVYTADQDKVNDAQQAYEDADNRLYNLSLKGQQEFTEKYLQATQEMYNQLTELQQAWLNGGISSEEEYERRKEEILNHYLGPEGVLTTYQNLYNIAVRTDADATADNWQKDYAAMTQNTEDWKVAVNDYLIEIEGQTAQWAEVSEQANEDVEGALNDSATATKELTNESENLKDMINEEVIPAIEDELDWVKEQTEAYVEQRKELFALIKTYEDYINTINQQIETESKLGYDKNTDYSALMMGYLKAGGSKNDPQYKQLEHQREAKIDGEQLSKDYYGSRVGDDNYNIQADNTWYKDKNAVNEKLKDLGIQTFATGGYTGDWGSEGKLAILHEKELILNEKDTSNLLSTISFIRDLVSLIDSQATAASLYNLMSAPGVITSQEVLEQKVEIYAEFPNATDHSEIEEAFNNLINTASQYANRK